MFGRCSASASGGGLRATWQLSARRPKTFLNMNCKNKNPHDLPRHVREILDQANLDTPRKRALEHLPRLEVFLFLMSRSDGRGTSEEELVDVFGMSIRLVEYHLKVLYDADLVASVAENEPSATERGYVATAVL